ncbi:MAG: bacterio-opsin activator domain-containing protein [Haloferacaceae archaeon]
MSGRFRDRYLSLVPPSVLFVGTGSGAPEFAAALERTWRVDSTDSAADESESGHSTERDAPSSGRDPTGGASGIRCDGGEKRNGGGGGDDSGGSADEGTDGRERGDATESSGADAVVARVAETANDLLRATSRDEVSDALVTVAREAFDVSYAVVALFEEDRGALVPTAWSSTLDHLGATPTPLSPGSDPAWNAFVANETTAFDGGAAGVFDGVPDVAAELAVPLGDYGVVVLGDTDGEAFDGTAREFVEILAAGGEAALDRLESGARLRRVEDELAERTETIDRLTGTLDQFSDVFAGLLRANTREKIRQTVCETLADVDHVEFVSVSAPEHVDEQLTVETVAGDDRGYFERVSLALDDGDAAEPSVRAAHSSEVVAVENVATDLREAAWRKEALSRSVQSVIGVPLVYGGISYGVLTVYSSLSAGLDEVFRSLLVEFGHLVAYAVNAVERTEALFTDRVVELEFQTTESTCFFVRFVQRADVSLRFEGIVPESGPNYLVFVCVAQSAVDDVLEVARETTPVVGDGSVVDESEDEALVRLRLAEDILPVTLAEFGLHVDHIEADPSETRLSVEVAPTMSVQRAVDAVTTLYPDAELVSKRRGRPQGRTTDFADWVVESLTDRQFEAARLAFERGFFDSPRSVTGTEVAEAMDISSSAFHRHLRAAEYSLFDVVFDRQEPGDAPE